MVRWSRRQMLMLATGAGAVSAASVGSASAETVEYEYDALGRLVRVRYATGATVDYDYDAAGNRTQVVSAASSGSRFTATIPLPSSTAIELGSFAAAAGYDFARNATIEFLVPNGVLIDGFIEDGEFYTALWFGGFGWRFDLYDIQLTLRVQSGGAVRGAHVGGYGGGNAIYADVPGAIIVEPGGVIASTPYGPSNPSLFGYAIIRTAPVNITNNGTISGRILG